VTDKTIETKRLRTLKGKRLSGPLATPIDTSAIIPLSRDDLWAEYFERHFADLRRQRMAKMPELARHLGINFEHLDAANPDDMVLLCSCIGLELARLVIPGFQEKPGGLWRRSKDFAILVEIEKLKQRGTITSDFNGCIMYLTKRDPELARPHNETELKQKARTLQNRVAGLRAELKRAVARRDWEEETEAPGWE
jgi:hypothetical protein